MPVNTRFSILFVNEAHSNEHDSAILARRRNRSYGDKQNWRSVPLEWAAVERVC